MARLAEGAEIEHDRKPRDETVCACKGTGKMLINGEWVDVVGPGSVHFNPMTKIHATKNAGKDRLVVVSIFTPAMKDRDRIVVR